MSVLLAIQIELKEFEELPKGEEAKGISRTRIDVRTIPGATLQGTVVSHDPLEMAVSQTISEFVKENINDIMAEACLKKGREVYKSVIVEKKDIPLGGRG